MFAMHVLMHYMDWIALVVRVMRLQVSFAMILNLFQATEAVASNHSLEGKAIQEKNFTSRKNDWQVAVSHPLVRCKFSG